MVWSGSSLHVNLDAPEGGLRAEVIDAASGKVIPGFELSRCTRVQGDRLDAEVTWSGARASTLAGRLVRLRFELRRGSLYAFWTR
jgi:hypothetical protein